MKIADKLLQYEFNDSLRLIYATIIGNLILAIILMFPDFAGILQEPHILWCLSSGLVLLVLKKIYDWKSFSINTGILLIYLLGVLLEYLQAGLPGKSFANDTSASISKGLLFDMLVGIVPLAYLVTRAFLGLGLYWVAKASRKVD